MQSDMSLGSKILTLSQYDLGRCIMGKGGVIRKAFSAITTNIEILGVKMMYLFNEKNAQLVLHTQIKWPRKKCKLGRANYVQCCHSKSCQFH